MLEQSWENVYFKVNKLKFPRKVGLISFHLEEQNFPFNSQERASQIPHFFRPQGEWEIQMY